MSPYETFKDECAREITAQGNNPEVLESTKDFIERTNPSKYCYHFEWMGRPIIQYPQDILAMQEILFSLKPDLIIETGIAHGGSLIFSASILELNAICGGPQDAEVLGIDVDIRSHNREAIEAHPMARRISMIQGSSITAETIALVKAKAAGKKKILVCLDSNHTHEHVLEELKAYAPLVSVDSYCVVFDTIIEDLPDGTYPDRPWSIGNNPKTAVHEYLQTHSEFVIDKAIQDKLLITVCPDGYLKRIR